MNLHSDHTLFIKNNSQWITDLNTKCKLTKFLEDNIGEHLDGLGHGDDFLDITPKA